MQVWETAWARRPMLFINGNLDAARTRWSAPWDSKGKKMREDFLPRVEAAFYMHHFRSQAGGGMLLRCAASRPLEGQQRPQQRRQQR